MTRFTIEHDTTARPPSDSACLPRKMLNNLHIMERTSTTRRFTQSHPCPICGGHDGLGRGQGVRCFGYLRPLGHLRPLHPRGARRQPAAEPRRHLQPPAARRLPLRPDPRRCPGPGGRCPPRRREHAPPAGGAAVPLVFHAVGLPPQAATATARPSVSGSTATPPGTRSSASCASITGRRTARRPRATAPATGPPTGSGCCRVRTCPCRSITCRPSSPPRRRRPSPCSKARNAPTSPPPWACPTSRPAPTAPKRRSSPTGRRWPADRVAILGDAGEDGEGYAAQVAALLAALDPPARVQVVSLPGLSDGEDIEQFIEARRSAGRTRRRDPRRAACPDRPVPLIRLLSSRRFLPFRSAPPWAFLRERTAAAGPVKPPALRCETAAS